MSGELNVNESAEGTTDTEEDHEAQARSSSLNGGLDAAEMGRRSGLARREKRAREREQSEASAAENALTFRQRLGVSLSKLKQDELDAVVARMTAAGNANALARLADQAFGKPMHAEEDKPLDEGLASLTREQRAVVREWDAQRQADQRAGVQTGGQADEDPPTPSPPTPAAAEPLARESLGGTLDSDTQKE